MRNHVAISGLQAGEDVNGSPRLCLLLRRYSPHLHRAVRFQSAVPNGCIPLASTVFRYSPEPQRMNEPKSSYQSPSGANGSAATQLVLEHECRPMAPAERSTMNHHRPVQQVPACL